MSIEKRGRSREGSLILGRRLLIFTERIVNEEGLEDLEEMTEVNAKVAFGEDSFGFGRSWILLGDNGKEEETGDSEGEGGEIGGREG